MDVHVVIYYDNINIILLVNNSVYHVRTKHIEAHYHFVKEKVLTREINLTRLNIEYQVVDIFTEDLGIDEPMKFIKMFGVLKVDLSLRGSVDNSNLIN